MQIVEKHVLEIGETFDSSFKCYTNITNQCSKVFHFMQ